MQNGQQLQSDARTNRDSIVNGRAQADQILTTLKKHRWASDNHWLDDFTIGNTGLPDTLGPFHVSAIYGEGRVETGLYRVWGMTWKLHEVVLFDNISGPFAAFRKLVDVFEVWQQIKPVERVYFIGSELRVGALIKVGFSRDPEARLRALQTAHGERLQIFATIEGGKHLEEKYHRRWRTRRRNGEWFTVGDCIIKEIARLTGATP